MSRRQNRYLRRKAKRQAKRDEALKQYDNFEIVAVIDSLYKAANEAAKGVSWKQSVQRYQLNLFSNIAKTREELLAGKDVRKGFIEFYICERGKERFIQSVHFYERVAQKSLCMFSLYPVLTYNIILDNYASQKGKGTHFAIKRLTKFLTEHYKKYGNNGYILLVDFKSYFASIPHDLIKKNFRRYFTDEKIIKLADSFVDAFGDKGLGLGSETSQINAIVHINAIDHYIKEKARIRGYGRYMDDSFLIHESKEYLENLLEKLKKLYAEYGVILNTKKTYITDLKHGFTFLKTRFYLTDSGKIIKKPCREFITRERRKLKRQAKLVQQGVLSFEAVNTSYQSWRGSMKHRNARKTVYSMDLLFNKLFSEHIKKKEVQNVSNERSERIKNSGIAKLNRSVRGRGKAKYRRG